MKRALIYPNERRDEGLAVSHRLEAFLKEQGLEVQLYAPGLELSGFSFCAALGGDGTILRAGQLLLGTDTPIVGLNLGHLGYLTEMTEEDAEEKLLRVIRGDYSCEAHMMLDGELHFADGRTASHAAINEFVLRRSNSAGAASFTVSVNGSYMDSFRGDGILLATPCGSTGYNLSAGGPILNPAADNIVLTPLCNHSILERSLVLLGSDLIEIDITPDPFQDFPTFTTDGLYHDTLDGPCRLLIRKSRYHFPLIRLGNQNFFQILREKMQ